MYTFLRSQGFRVFMLAEAPYFVVAFAIANAFYKFHSFGLELFAFMGTWFALSAIGNEAVRWFNKRRAPLDRS